MIDASSETHGPEHEEGAPRVRKPDVGPNPDLAREQDTDVPHELLDEARQEVDYPADEGDEG